MLSQFIEILKWSLSHWQEFLVALGALLSGLVALNGGIIAIALMIPGAQPERFLYSVNERVAKIIDWIATLSRKPAGTISSVEPPKDG